MGVDGTSLVTWLPPSPGLHPGLLMGLPRSPFLILILISGLRVVEGMDHNIACADALTGSPPSIAELPVSKHCGAEPHPLNVARTLCSEKW